MKVDSRTKDLAEPLVLKHSKPGVQPEDLPAKLDLLAGRFPLLDPPQHVPEAAPLLLPVLLAPRLVRISCKLSHSNNQTLQVGGLILGIIVVGKLEDEGEALASCDAEVDVGGVEQASQGGDLRIQASKD